MPIGVMTLSDIAKSLDPNGKPARMINILGEDNEILDDMVFLEGNLTNGNQMTIETELPEPSIRRYNQGVPLTKGSSAQITETCVVFEDRSSIDKDLAESYGIVNVGEMRLSRARGHIAGFNRKVAKQLFYGASAEEIFGLANRYSLSTDANGDNIVKGGGSGSDNLSIYLIGWGQDKVFCVYPRGSKVGLIHEDIGLQDEFDSNNMRYRAYMDRWQWKLGLCVADWHYVVRICNIDVSNLVTETSAADLIKIMSKAIDRVPQGAAKLAFYCNRTVTSMLRIQALNKSSSAIAIEPALTQFGRPGGTLTFLGIPVRRVDQLLNTEAAVS